jgi:hypothetical protein
VNCYEAGQWIPPHVDNPKFARPFATLSLLSAQDVAFAPLPPRAPPAPTPTPTPSPGEAGDAGDDSHARRLASAAAAAANAEAARGDNGGAEARAANALNEFKEAPGSRRLPLPAGSLLVVGGAAADRSV